MTAENSSSKINWFELKYNHVGRWEKKIDSIMNPGTKITWLQYIAEMIICCRVQLLKDYKDIQRGPDWYKSISKAVRDLNQQASVICNYFPHIDDEPLVSVAFRNYFRKRRPLKIGTFRKVRFTEKDGRKVGNITQDEKDTVVGIQAELDRLIAQRNVFVDAAPKIIEEPKATSKVRFKTAGTSKKSSLEALIALEQEQIKKNTNG